MKGYIIHVTEPDGRETILKEFVSTSASVNGYKIYINENNDVIFEEPNNPVKCFPGFSGAKGVFAMEDNRFVIVSQNEEVYIFGNNDNGQIEEKTKVELYRSEKEVFKYTWDPYFEHPSIVHEATLNGKRPIRYWDASDTENYFKEKFFDKNFHLYDREVYLKYIDACSRYGEKNIKRDIVFDVDFNTTVYRDGDYYRQDFDGFKSLVMYKTNDFIYKPIKLIGSCKI